MSKFLAFMLTATLLAPLAASARDGFKLEKGRPITIVLADSSSPAEKTAARELKDYLSKLIGATCEIVAEAHASEPAIFVGPTSFAAKSGVNCATLGKEEWLLRATGGSLVVAGGRPRGTLYAAYEMLERLGVAWSDVDTEYVPPLAAQTLDWNLRGKPALMNRSIYSGVGPSPSTVRFLVRNRMNAQCAFPEELGGSERHGSPNDCHTFHAYTTKAWPDDWFAMDKKGRRVRSTSGSGPGQFCLTSPDVRQAVCAQLRAFIKRDREKAGSPALYPRIYDISHNDCDGECHCPACSAVLEREGAYSGVLLDFINFVASDIAKDYPDILIQTFAYTFTLDAPKHIKPAANVIVRVCKLGCEFLPSGKADTQFSNSHPRNRDYRDNFLRWADISPNLAVWDYWIVYTKSYHPPYLNARSLQEDIAFYRDHRVKTLFVECEAASETSFYPFKIWFGLKMMQNPGQAYDELAGRFCRAQYGPAARPMLTCLNYLQDREAAADTALGLTTPNALAYLDRDFFNTVNALFDEAEDLASGNPTAWRNIVRERVPVDAALLNLSKRYPRDLPAGGKPSCDLPSLFARFETNSLIQANRFFNSDAYARNKDQLAEAETKLATAKMRFTGRPLQLPPEFVGKEVVDINWSAFQSGNAVEDADGLAGKACLLRDGEGRKDYHRLPFQMGLYCRAKKKFLAGKNLPAEEIPQDGKFHLYPLGKHTIEPTTIFWAHWTWYMSIVIDTAYLPGADNDWDVYASIKLVGAPYQKDSKEPARVLVDRILLVR
ncbi:MAG TPA: DUF4838 domain-containing protein [Kiritimatiellia bacterium]|nr:DUF4838 domain-containing protein [Kiritimatiellia bacterium]HPS07842.1 DUF4838 domain-containing protein [Kiritimatiellia bacterium]